MKDVLLGASILLNIILIAAYNLFVRTCKKEVQEYKNKNLGGN
ncbi:hypothetical protein [Clostridium culturomicium]|nr:hypothetical protein [Clostridium culturomicium]